MADLLLIEALLSMPFATLNMLRPRALDPLLMQGPFADIISSTFSKFAFLPDNPVILVLVRTNTFIGNKGQVFLKAAPHTEAGESEVPADS